MLCTRRAPPGEGGARGDAAHVTMLRDLQPPAPTCDRHTVALYASDGHLVAWVTEFLIPALRSGTAALVVATEDHRRLFTSALSAAGIDVESCSAEGRLVCLDAAGTLSRFMGPVLPEASAFDATVGELVRDLGTRFGGVRIYGEMVALLWAGGDAPAAIALEDLWNDLAPERPLDLLCAYPMSLFGADDATEPFERMCGQHTAVVPDVEVGDHTQALRAIALLEQRIGASSAERSALLRDKQHLEEMLARLHDLDRKRNEFVAMVVHDIRTPVSIMSGFLGLLRDNWPSLDQAQIDDFLARGIDGGRQVERLVDDVLTVAGLESGHFEYGLHAIDLRGIVYRAVAAVRDATSALIEVLVPSSLPRAYADEARQVQVLNNLLTNAVKFSPSGEPVVVSVEERHGELVVDVTDRGPGISAEDCDHLFLPFARAADTRSTVKGTGLGLFIAKSLVEGQGGTISVRPNPAGGSTFSFTVPIWAPAAD